MTVLTCFLYIVMRACFDVVKVNNALCVVNSKKKHIYLLEGMEYSYSFLIEARINDS